MNGLVPCNHLFDSFANRVYCNWAQSIVEQAAFAVVSIPFVTIIHELGRAGAACRYSTLFLSRLGNRLGTRNVRVIVAAAGPLSQMTAALLLLYFSPGNGVSHYALNSNFRYALSALYKEPFFEGRVEEKYSHDFVEIKILKGRAAYGAFAMTSMALLLLRVYQLLFFSFKMGEELARSRNLS